MAPFDAAALMVIPSFGDLNCDGETNVLDVQLTVMSALNLPLSPLIDADDDGAPDWCNDYQGSLSGDCEVGQVIKWDGTLWVCADDEASAENAELQEQVGDLTQQVESLQVQLNALIEVVNQQGGGQGSSGGVQAYEPWNPSVLLSPIHLTDKVYWAAFYAPSTGDYTHATVKTSTGPYNHNKKFVGDFSVGVYDNEELSAPAELLSQYTVQNIPSGRLGAATHVYENQTDIRGFLTFEFEEPVYLMKDQMYWFAITQNNQYNSSHFVYLDFHADYNVVNGTVLEEDGESGGILPEFVPGPNALKFSERAYWFRIFGSDTVQDSADSLQKEVSP